MRKLLFRRDKFLSGIQTANEILLEVEDRTEFRSHIIPLTRRHSAKERQRLVRIRVRSVKRLFEGKRYPAIQVIVDGSDNHRAETPVSRWAEPVQISRLGLVDAIQSVEGPPCIASSWMRVEDA